MRNFSRIASAESAQTGGLRRGDGPVDWALMVADAALSVRTGTLQAQKAKSDGTCGDDSPLHRVHVVEVVEQLVTRRGKPV